MVMYNTDNIDKNSAKYNNPLISAKNVTACKLQDLQALCKLRSPDGT